MREPEVVAFEVWCASDFVGTFEEWLQEQSVQARRNRLYAVTINGPLSMPPQIREAMRRMNPTQQKLWEQAQDFSRNKGEMITRLAEILNFRIADLHA